MDQVPWASGRIDAVTARWRCPVCHATALVKRHDDVACTACGARFAVIAGSPLLTSADNDLFGPHRYVDRSPAAKARGRRYAPDLSINLSRERCLTDLARRLTTERPDATVLVVGSGGQRPEIEQRLAAAGGAIDVIACDVAPGADIDVLCDAHELPFADASINAVVTTAVLEHVADPVRAMSEIERVLIPGGYLYCEIPFMQQVHEGAYDFTRFTMSGHRRLAAGFEEIAAGVVAGPATSLAWAIEHFALAFTRRRRARGAVKFAVRWAFGWLKLLDHMLAARPAAEDGASCTYFYGRLALVRRSDADVVAGYSGAQSRS